MSRPEIVIVGGKRTAMAEDCGTPGFGLFKDLSATDLGGHAIRAALEDAGVKPDAADHVVMGNAMQTSVDAHYGGRHAALKAGIPDVDARPHGEPHLRFGDSERDQRGHAC
jgi:acetyl-CoA C-acetyltransferase